MKKEYRKVITLEEADVDKANEVKKALLKLMPQLNIEDQDMDVLHEAVSYLDDLITEYYD